MKKIKAYVKSHRLSEVTLALHKIKGMPGMSVTEVKGFGRRSAPADGLDQVNGPEDFISISKIEIFCLEEMVDSLVETIEKVAHTGLCGDGKIYVVPVEQAVRISTGERGPGAV